MKQTYKAQRAELYDLTTLVEHGKQAEQKMAALEIEFENTTNWFNPHTAVAPDPEPQGGEAYAAGSYGAAPDPLVDAPPSDAGSSVTNRRMMDNLSNPRR